MVFLMLSNPFSKVIDGKKHAVVNARYLKISHKDSVEIGNWIKGMSTEVAKKKLKMVLEKKLAVPYKRFNRDLPHKKGIASGRYPVNATKEIIKLIESAEKNAEFKGFDTTKLIIKYFSANKANNFYRPSRARFRGRVRKNTNITIVLEDVSKK